MTSIISPLHPLPCRGIAGVMLIGIVLAGSPGVATPRFTLNIDAADKALKENLPPSYREDPLGTAEREAGQAREARQRLRDAKLRAETQEVVAPLEADRQRWRELYAESAEIHKEFAERRAELDEELARVIDLAKQDEPLHAWAKFLQVVSLTLALAQEFVPESPPPETTATGQTPPETAPANQTPTDSTPPQDGWHMREQYQGTIEVCKDGTCRLIEMQQVIREATEPLADVKEAAQMRSQLRQIAAGLPPLRCDLGGDRCRPLDTGSVTAIVPADLSPVVPPPGRPALPPKRGRTDTLTTIPPSVVPPPGRPALPPPSTTPPLEKQVFSLLADLTPGLGFGKSVVELVSGKDPVTDELVSKPMALVGLAGSVIPGGKPLIKIVTRGGKHIKGPRALRHYTNRKGSNAIAKEGVIKADKRNTVFVVPARERVLSRADAEDALGLRPGRGRDYVVFEAPKGTQVKEVYNPVTRRKEWKISGDIRLDPKRAEVVQRD